MAVSAKQTDYTLLEQMQITDFEIETRKRLLGFSADDAAYLHQAKPCIIPVALDRLVVEFYEAQTAIPEVALLIGDADTLNRLQNGQRRYIADLFSGVYDLDYVNYRLRIGLVHKRIGVEPKLYLAAVHGLKTMLVDHLVRAIADPERRDKTIGALEKLFMFDTALVFETYIRSLVSEIESSKEKSDRYASLLEAKVRERTEQFEQLSRTDALTGLMNVRHLHEILTRSLRAAERREEPISVVYIDIDDFKSINDTDGHQRGDDVIRSVADALKASSRAEDICFRYGGDEFCVVLPNCLKEHAAETYMYRVKNKLSSVEPDVTLSFGAAQTGPDIYIDTIELIGHADKEMYKAKKSAKNGRLQLVG